MPASAAPTLLSLHPQLPHLVSVCGSTLAGKSTLRSGSSACAVAPPAPSQQAATPQLLARKLMCPEAAVEPLATLPKEGYIGEWLRRKMMKKARKKREKTKKKEKKKEKKKK
mmetsp:Transcript_35919/g.84077  ORF Transcript_35919/g.84077 Transcript_35919/m.84077 type:complete len:112 (+) Transcript_35919:33-368(+)